VNAASKIAGGFVIAVVVLAIVAGLSSGPGSQVVANLWDAIQIAGRWAVTQIVRLSNSTNTRGNGARALVAGLISFLVLVFVVPAFRKNSTGVFTLVALAGAIAFVLFDPTILPTA
jgi:hypothetical protein